MAGESEGLDTMDESTMDSTALDAEKEHYRYFILPFQHNLAMMSKRVNEYSLQPFVLFSVEKRAASV